MANDNHSKYDDSNQYNDEWHNYDSLAFLLSRFGDNNPDNSPTFPPHNGASTRVSAFMMNDIDAILMDDDYTTHRTTSPTTMCEFRAEITTSPFEDSFYDESYVQGKRSNPNLRDVPLRQSIAQTNAHILQRIHGRTDNLKRHRYPRKPHIPSGVYA
jgi:hypothetical protein